MADEKLTQQVETTDIADDDILYVVRDPATVPISRKMKFSNLVAEFPDATDAVEGKVELATTDEAIAGTDTTRAVTPAGLLAGIVQNPGGAFLASAVLATTDTYTFSTSDFPASYEHLLIRGWDLYSSCDNTYLAVRFNGDSGANYSYETYAATQVGGSVDDGGSGATATRITVGDGLRNASTQPMMFEIKIFNYTGSTFYKCFMGNWTTPATYSGICGGMWSNTAAITSITFLPGTNNLSGTIAIYGFNT